MKTEENKRKTEKSYFAIQIFEEFDGLFVKIIVI